MRSSLVLELDVMPAEMNPARLCDFAGRMVSAFTDRTLLLPRVDGGAPEPSILAGLDRHEDGRRWRLMLGESAVWSDGRPITAKDLLGTLETARRATGVNCWIGCLLQSARRVAADVVEVDLVRPMGCFPEILTTELFAPRSPRGQGAGTFSLVGHLGGGRSLALRRNAAGDMHWPDGPEDVIFVVTQSPEQGVRLFERGLLDVTCNPSLPDGALARYAGSAELRRGDLNLCGTLMFAAEDLRGVEHRARRQNIAAAIDRKALAERGLRPLVDFCDLWREPETEEPDAQFAAKMRWTRSLTLGYADFSPNGHIAERLAVQLTERLGVTVVSHRLDYQQYLACLARPCVDLLYALIQPAYPDPTSLFANLAASRWVDLSQTSYHRALAEAEAELEPRERLAACARLQHILDEEMPIVPLLRVSSKFLASSKAEDLRLGSDGILRPPSPTFDRMPVPEILAGGSSGLGDVSP